MVGRLRLGDDAVTLGDDLRWSSETAPSLADLFNATFGPGQYPGPSGGFPGPFLFGLAVDETGATILDAPAPVDAPEGRIY